MKVLDPWFGCSLPDRGCIPDHPWPQFPHLHSRLGEPEQGFQAMGFHREAEFTRQLWLPTLAAHIIFCQENPTP